MIIAMMGMTALGMVMMTGILTAEIFIVGQQGGRLSWPYGDLVPGNYLAKAGLPAFCVLVALAVSDKRPVNSLAAIVSFVTIILSVVTGERINFIIRACGGMLAGLVWRPKFSRYAVLVWWNCWQWSPSFLPPQYRQPILIDLSKNCQSRMKAPITG